MSHLASEQAKAEVAAALGLYVHVPFCASTCDFCAFYQTKPTAPDVKRFLRGIADELRLVRWPRPVNTVFWGGGTPGLLSARDLNALAQSVREALPGGGAGVEEWTIEMTPLSATDARLAVLKAVGVTRVSLGVQSFQPPLLEALGRRHTREQAFRAYERVRAAGFHSVNLDLMFALPGQSADEWAADIRQAVALGPDHLSTYCLTFEEDTAMWVKLAQGRVKLDPENETRLYEATWEQLAAAGYAQYEVSNFARPGHACRHNLNTWRMQEWVGVGPSAASQQGGWRGTNVADLERWLGNVARGERATEDRVPLGPAQLAEDALIFGLRMNAGVDLAVWRRQAPDAPWAAVEDLLAGLQAEGLLAREGEVIRLTTRGRLLADAVGSELMSAFAAREIRRPEPVVGAAD